MNARVFTLASGLALSLTFAACERSPSDQRAGPNPPASAAHQPDNSARNEADRNANAKTPLDQSNDPAAIKITADIRRAILDDPTMSINAQNCKVITDKSGVVTLRGPVASESEKTAIEAKARAVPGVTGVVNQLEVKTG